ncbi:ABC transporter substrate-binding protein [Paenibacillus hamazuiensis]|uniref:ABC transporter substrate-binding protein n=1 Tax=Paenibacillus hamazuiensis TaxID=2936508 RepID=UPI00200DC21E|nr:extracellular solute-binding protein [Paenibacillus hamazuiensis]
MNRKHAAVSIGLLAALTLAAGCTSGTVETAEPKEADPQAVPAPGNAGPVEITVYSAPGDSEESWNENFGNAIKKKFPNYTIKFINPRGNDALKIQNQITAGQNIDIYYESIGGFFSSVPDNNLQFDLTDLIKKYKVDLSRFEPTAIEAMKKSAGGQIWGLPVYTNNMILYYNKDIFDKFAVAYPKDGMTWDEVTALSKQLNKRDGGKQYMGLAVSPSHVIRMNPYSVPLVDPQSLQATINKDERWKKMFQTFFEDPASDAGYREGIQARGNKLPYTDQFTKDQTLAMFVMISTLPTLLPQDFAQVNWDMTSAPTFQDLPGTGTQSYPTYFLIPNFSKHKEEAFQIIQYLTSDEVQKENAKKGVMSVLKGDEFKTAYGQESRFKDKNLKAAFYNSFAPIMPKTKYDSIVEKAYTKSVVDLSLGNIDLNTLRRNAEEEANKGIASLANK